MLHKSLLVLSLALFCLASIFCVFQALAHAPLSSGPNESLETATLVPNPSKSWVIYGELHEGAEAQYYYFNITKGARIFISLLKSTEPSEAEFVPSFVLMGPNITSQGTAPSYVNVTSSYGSVVVNGVQPSQAIYEPFSPSSLYQVAEKDMIAPESGKYYIAVFEPTKGGHYSLAVGYVEEFTLNEWILIPFNLIAIYQWEGQSLLQILAPLAATLIIGLAFMTWRRKTRGDFNTLFRWFAGLAGLLFIGTGLMTLLQMIVSVAGASLGFEVSVTLIFALIPILLGIAALRISLKTQQVTFRTRVYIAIIGIAALFTWAGLIIGPILAIIGSLLPPYSTPTEPNTS